jgi:hypothetical protein
MNASVKCPLTPSGYKGQEIHTRILKRVDPHPSTVVLGILKMYPRISLTSSIWQGGISYIGLQFILQFQNVGFTVGREGLYDTPQVVI